MSSSLTRPVPIGSPREGHRVNDPIIPDIVDDILISASSQPDLDRLRERVTGTPPPNIPQRPFASNIVLSFLTSSIYNLPPLCCTSTAHRAGCWRRLRHSIFS
ncbi:hypothetical protein FRB94_012297 [Tulasnella sp. JGI-2019a]|nr:hypothetical protein FRB94_012297 [Tulasnella sp. JGI-2019a]